MESRTRYPGRWISIFVPVRSHGPTHAIGIVEDAVFDHEHRVARIADLIEWRLNTLQTWRETARPFQ